jgi:aminopeptidase YwaD
MGNKTGTIDVAAATAECMEETRRLVAEHGPRLPGSSACTAAAEDIARTMRTFADSVRAESFRVHPGSFYAYSKILPVSYLVGMAALFAADRVGPRALFGIGALAVVGLAAAGLAAGIALMVCQFGIYRHLGDTLFPARTGTNVEAVVEPVGEAERELLLSGHHDSAPVARIFSGPFSRFYVVAIIAPYLFFAGELVLLLVRLSGPAAAAPRGWVPAFLLAGLPFIAGYFFLVALRRGSPGAGDNLVSSMMVVGLGRQVAARRETLLGSTRLRILSFDAEEAGLRGASSYFRTHVAGLKRLPCVHLNFDSLYRLQDLQVLTSDINGTVRLSRPLVDRLVECAKECGFEMRTFGMIFGAGGTDAAESARRGIPSTSIIALPTEILRDRLVYHTPCDTVEHIEPAVVEACMRIALRLLAKLEAGEAVSGSAVRPGRSAPHAARRRP